MLAGRSAIWKKPAGCWFADWCRKHGINVHSLAAHKKNIERAEHGDSGVIDFIEVKLLPPPTLAAYQIDLANGHTIRLDDHFKVDRLREIIDLVATC